MALTCWRKGFTGKVPPPIQLVGCEGLVIIPLARGYHSNPIYKNRPGDSNAVMLASDCGIPLYAKRFALSSKLQCDAGSSHNAPHSCRMFFVSAEIDLPEYGIMNGWINIWMGESYTIDVPPTGTLYCTLPDLSLRSRNMLRFCLCGTCQDSWFAQGWVCKLVQHKAPVPPGCDCSPLAPGAYNCAACCAWYPAAS